MQNPIKGWTLLLCIGLSAQGYGSCLEDFEGPTTTWRPMGGDVRYRIADHRRVQQNPYRGLGCEQISLVGNNGSSILFYHPIPPARVISELVLSLHVRSDRPGVQMLLRVVLPRTVEPDSGQPMTTLIEGPETALSGGWELLQADGIPPLLDRRVWALRSQLGPHVDAREAYVDRVVLNVFTGPGPVTVWIDELAMVGHVEASEREVAAGPSLVSPTNREPQRLPPVDGPAVPRPPRDVRFDGTVLTVDGRPMLPRVIQYQGEPLRFLKGLGFNVISTATPASPALLEEADQLGLWFISPPPSIDQLSQQGVDPRFDPVLAWDMGSALGGPQKAATAHWAREISRSDPNSQRPLLGSCTTDQRAYSRILSILVADRAPLGTSLELSDYARWMAGQRCLALPGTPLWARVQTQLLPNQSVRPQTQAAGGTSPTGVDDGQIRLLTWVALSAGVKGLMFDSSSPLTGTDVATQRRSQALELTNLQLGLVEPWTASATTLTTATSSDPQVTGTLLHSQSERARLLIPIHWQRGGQYVSSPPAKDLSLVVPGVPESNGVYEVTFAGLRELRHRRVTGGIRIWLEQVDALAVILMTQDTLVHNSLAQRIHETGRRASQLLLALTTDRFGVVQRVHRGLTGQVRETSPRGELLMAAAAASLQRAHALWHKGDHGRAFNEARQAARALDQVQRLDFEQVVQAWGSPGSSPLAVHYGTLPELQALAEQLRTSRLGHNRLTGGDFEDLGELQRSGWQHYRHPVAGLHTEVALTPTEPYSGRFSLRLSASPEEGAAPHLVTTPPVWVTSPPVQVPAGQLVRIHGWVRVPELGTGNDEGLLIIDSLAGEASAERIGPTRGWRELTLFRIAPPAGIATVTFALTGYGQAEIDGMTIAPVELPARNVPTNAGAVGAFHR